MTKAVQHVVDVRTDPAFLDGDPGITALARLTGARTLLVVPMLKDDNLIGAFGIYRQEVRAFSDKQIDLVRNFANQAVIAIENTRLLNELRQRTNDLTESLEQQTATTEVLQIISSSPGDLEPVFAAMLEKAVRICDARFGNIYRWDGEALHLATTHNAPPAYAEERRRVPHYHPSPKIGVGRMVATKKAVHVVDAAIEPAYIERHPAYIAAVELGGARTYLTVPMLKDNELIGALSVFRQEVRPFTDKQIALVTSFADQAVIAIENARLLTELRQRTDELGRIGRRAARARRSDPGGELDARPPNRAHDDRRQVGAAVADRRGRDLRVRRAAARISAARHLRHGRGADRRASTQQQIGLGTIRRSARRRRRRAPMQSRRPARGSRASPLTDIILQRRLPRAARHAAARAATDIVGALVVRRRAPGALRASIPSSCCRPSPRSRWWRSRTRGCSARSRRRAAQLAVASQHKSQFLANMSHELRTPLERHPRLHRADPRRHLRRGAGEDARGAGAGADQRQASARPHQRRARPLEDRGRAAHAVARRTIRIKELVQGVYVAVEPLATQQEPRAQARASPGACRVGRGDERRLAQVLLNLVGNAIKFTDAGEVDDRAPSHADGAFTIAVRDTGPGIAAADQAKIFEEFQQADNSITRAEGRHRARARDLQAHRRDAWRPHLGRFRARQGIDLLVHASRQRRPRRWRTHEQADSGGRGPGGQPADPARSAGQRRLSR